MISQLEKEVTLRYLKTRKQDGFLNVISIFSFIGIALGVAVLIIVMSVMNGFRTELVEKIGLLSTSRRQDQETEVTPNGALYLISWKEFKKTQKIYSNSQKSYGLLMNQMDSIEIETNQDLEYARFLVSKGYFDVNDWLEVKSA